MKNQETSERTKMKMLIMRERKPLMNPTTGMSEMMPVEASQSVKRARLVLQDPSRIREKHPQKSNIPVLQQSQGPNHRQQLLRSLNMEAELCRG
jgi:hypothetical protein